MLCSIHDMCDSFLYSRAICSYLATQYGKDDTLYPNNPVARSVVDARLYFDMGTLYHRWSEYGVSGAAGDIIVLGPHSRKPWFYKFLSGI